MKVLLVLLGMSLSAITQAQGECLKTYTSHHFVLNTTADTVSIWVDNKDQKSFPTKGPKHFLIAPNKRLEVSDLGWAEQFRDPTGWYIFKVETSGLTNLCDARNWTFEKLNETQGEYSLTLKMSDDGKCEMDENSMLNGKLIPVPEVLQIEEEQVYDITNPEPQFPGGPEKMFHWIRENIQYPQTAIDENISGKVYVQFIVEKTGKLSNIKILRSGHDSLSRETVRLIKSMPKWDPGMDKGKTVRVRYNLPIVFKIG